MNRFPRIRRLNVVRPPRILIEGLKLRSSSRITAIILGLVVGACQSAATPGWTYAPAPSLTPPPSASQGPASAAPPAGSPSAPAGAGTSISIAAVNIKFDQAELRAPADTPFMIVFDNQEPVPHNVAIYSDSSGGNKLFVGEIFPGPGTRSYAVPALPAGTYFFRCDVHPTAMTGTFISQ